MSPHPGRLRPFPGSLTIEHEAGGLRVLRLSGDVDSAVVAEYESRQGRLPVVVDVIDAGAVSFLGSAGLAVMVRYAEAGTAVGRRPVLRAASAPVDQLLRVAGMETYFARPEAMQPGAGDEAPERSGHQPSAEGRGLRGGRRG
jgi:anti-anti-sigma factor